MEATGRKHGHYLEVGFDAVAEEEETHTITHIAYGCVCENITTTYYTENDTRWSYRRIVNLGSRVDAVVWPVASHGFKYVDLLPSLLSL